MSPKTAGYTSDYYCETCNDGKCRTKQQVIEHMKKVHSIHCFQGKKELLLHINREPRHISTYRWTIDGVIISEHNY